MSSTYRGYNYDTCARRAAASVLYALTFTAALALAGCDSGPKPVPVSGRVLLDGQPLTEGDILVIPAQGRPAMAKIESDGRFTLGCYGESDGCLPGTHPVQITAKRLTPDPRTGAPVATWLAPERYADAKQSGLTITVGGPIDDLTIELTRTQ